MKKLGYTFFGGFCMALADSVPGVSGGTIAFLMGFYDAFVGSLDALIHGTKQERLHGLIYLLKLAAGWVVGMALAVTVLAGAFSDGIYQLSSLFLGFVLVSIPLVMREQRAALGAFRKNLLPFLGGVVLVVGLAALHLSALVNDLGLRAGTVLYAFAAGALAVSAMVLPGISGSSLLMHRHGTALPRSGARDRGDEGAAPFSIRPVLATGRGRCRGSGRLCRCTASDPRLDAPGAECRHLRCAGHDARLALCDRCRPDDAESAAAGDDAAGLSSALVRARHRRHADAGCAQTPRGKDKGGVRQICRERLT